MANPFDDASSNGFPDVSTHDLLVFPESLLQELEMIYFLVIMVFMSYLCAFYHRTT